MRYTESDFTIDHVFDFIRLVFSSIFLAPFRFCNEYSKKLLFLDKECIRKHVLLALALVLFLAVTEGIGIIRANEFVILASNIPALLLAFIIIGALYYLVMIYDQPKVTYGVKPEKPKKEKQKRKPIKFDAEDLIEDNEEELERLAKEKEVETSDISNGIDLSGIKFNMPEKEKVEVTLDALNNQPKLDYNFYAQTPKEAVDELQQAYKEDAWGMEDLWNSTPDYDAIDDLRIKLDNIRQDVDFSELRKMA